MQMLAGFEPPKFRSEGHHRLRPRSRSGPCPLRPHLYGYERGRTSSTQRTSPAQHEQAMRPTGNPPNARREGVASVDFFACHRVRFRMYSAPFVRFLLSNRQHTMTTKAKRWRYNRCCEGMVPKT
jgi:hypothetical protein